MTALYILIPVALLLVAFAVWLFSVSYTHLRAHET